MKHFSSSVILVSHFFFDGNLNCEIRTISHAKEGVIYIILVKVFNYLLSSANTEFNDNLDSEQFKLLKVELSLPQENKNSNLMVCDG